MKNGMVDRFVTRKPCARDGQLRATHGSEKEISKSITQLS
jgi:hypothetical protein